MNKVIEVKDLYKLYRVGDEVVRALNGVGFDIYEGDQIKDGYKSMAYSITFRAKDRTLEEADVTGAMKKILNGLEGMGIELRS